MSVKQDGDGRRYVELEFEVPGTPEDVWQAIATGPGITAWFVPTQVEERVGGKVSFRVMENADSPGHVTAWEPPTRFAYEETAWSESAPPLATECVVQARAGGTCVVRIVSSLFTESSEWDGEMEGFEAGWPPYFDVLRLYLRHFNGQRCAPLRVMQSTAGSEADVWQRLTAALGLVDAKHGSPLRRSHGAPELRGVVERVGSAKQPHEILVRLDAPAPGVALLGAYAWGGAVYAAMNLYLYGPEAEAAMQQVGPAWRAWIREQFPAPAEN